MPAAVIFTNDVEANVSADKDVKLAELACPPNPDNVYVGIFNTLEINEEAPELPVVVNEVILFVYAVSHVV